MDEASSGEKNGRKIGNKYFIVANDVNEISMQATIILPNQLFEHNPVFDTGVTHYFLVEEPLFFSQFPFHKRKIALHRASMQFYKDFLLSKAYHVTYYNAQEPLSDIRNLIVFLANHGYSHIVVADPVDNYIERRLTQLCDKHNLSLTILDTPLFINSKADLDLYFKGKTKYFQTDFYIQQRKKLGILLNNNQKPQGGKWSFDTDNRKKIPKGTYIHNYASSENDLYYREACSYVEKYFSGNYGVLDDSLIFPHNFVQAAASLDDFLEKSFEFFGPYEDALIAEKSFLFHSVLTPALNIGLITPAYVIERTLQWATMKEIALASLEGFIRQLIGWREFIRGVYVHAGTRQRNSNFWQSNRPLPQTFWTGNTGIFPVDVTIAKLLSTAYSNHIERLMVMSNFMLLSHIAPKAIYEWFMTLYIDAYDWVMVPNVFGMSLFADGGIMSTKPYISSSNYLMKMSNYPKGDWQEKWDALFWYFMTEKRSYFEKNIRSNMLLKVYDKFSAEKKAIIQEVAQDFFC